MSVSQPPTDGRPSALGRRRFLGGVGAGLAGAAAGPLVLGNLEALAESVEGPAVFAAPDPRFSRMFNLPAFAGKPLKPWRRPLVVESDGNIGYQ